MTKTQREYKDRLFRFLFGSSEHKDWSLQLYNILMGTEFSDPDQLTLFTLENVLYKTWKNDIAMIGPDGRLLLVEQQSTPSVNLPVRMLSYVSQSLNKYLALTGRTWFDARPIEIPAPFFYTVYNGTIRLSAYTISLSSLYSGTVSEQALDLRTVWIDINGIQENEGHGKCRPLYEYQWFVKHARQNMKNMSGYQAFRKALEDMPENFVIRNYLTANQKEVIMLSLYEYDEKLVRKNDAEYYYENGFLDGERKGKNKGLAEGKLEGESAQVCRMICSIMKNHGFSFDETCRFLCLTEEEIRISRKRLEESGVL
ncbi:MAG: hypothetical protein IKG46_06395 [Solobacterium sp.]|nr:hypothetical protein [Solobacterium sp.]